MAMSGKVKERQAVTIYNSCIDRTKLESQERQVTSNKIWEKNTLRGIYFQISLNKILVGEGGPKFGLG